MQLLVLLFNVAAKTTKAFQRRISFISSLLSDDKVRVSVDTFLLATLVLFVHLNQKISFLDQICDSVCLRK